MRSGLLVVVLLAAGLTLGCQKKPAQDVSTLPPPSSTNEPMPSGVSTPPTAVTPAPTGSAGGATAAPGSAANPGGRTHVVKPGETLYSIARAEYGDAKKMHDIAKANNISDPNKIKVGQVLVLP